MKVLTPGHRYALSNFEHPEDCQILQFIQKEPSLNRQMASLGKLDTISDGTTNEELLEALIDRMQFLQSKFPCYENEIAITKFEEGLMWLNKRTADREKRNVEGKYIA